jgi:hypothetical protein
VYFESFEHRQFSVDGRATILRKPQHGTLKPNAEAPGGYLYLPKADYFGADRATFLVEAGGRKIKMEYFFRVMESVPELGHEDKRLCPRGLVWKISFSLDHPISRGLASHARYSASDSNRPVGLVGFPAIFGQAQAA